MGAEAQFWDDAERLGFSSVFAMDFEGGDRTGVVEYGVVEITAAGLGDTWTGLCAPADRVPSRESETHGLSQGDLSDQPAFAASWEFFRDLRRNGPFLAHSAQVEDRFLRRQWRTPGEVPEWANAGGKGIGWGPWLDSCGLYRTLRPTSPAGLSELIRVQGLEQSLGKFAAERCPEARCQWHAALYDSIASALLFVQVLRECPDWSVRRFFRESQSRGEAPSEQMNLL